MIHFSTKQESLSNRRLSRMDSGAIFLHEEGYREKPRPSYSLDDGWSACLFMLGSKQSFASQSSTQSGGQFS